MMRQKLTFACALVALGCASPAGVSQTGPTSRAPAPKAAQDERLYRNATFGFRYKIPFGWVDRTKEMREQAAAKADSSAAKDESSAVPKGDLGDADSSSSNPKASLRARAGKNKSAGALPSEVLLAIFERPPDAAGESINSAVVIASENAASYPGLKTEEDFLGPLTELATAEGFKASGDPSALTIDTREVVRADFAKALTDKLSMYQSTLDRKSVV